MVQIRRLASVSFTALLLAGVPAVAFAQQSNPEWFVPGQQRPGAAQAPRPAGPPRPGPAVQQQQQQMPQDAMGGGQQGGQGELPIPPHQLQVQLPPAPDVPVLPKTDPPPPAVVGILSVPDVLRLSSAYQQADRELGLRRQRLNEDAQKEQVTLRDLGQAFANERAKLTPEQIRAKERTFQDRVNESRRSFGDRNRIIQEAGQYVMAQIDRTLELVAQQVSVARGVNLVLNRAQLLGTTAEFDLTPQVAEVLNQVLPSVVIPPDGVSPMAMPRPTSATGPAVATGTPPAASTGAKPAAQPQPQPAAPPQQPKR